jgi:hypothetical protein
LARVTHQLGMSLYFQIAPPTPRWATVRARAGQGAKLGRMPNMNDFKKFVEAAGRRYSGSFGAHAPRAVPPVPGGGLPVPQLPGPSSSPPSSDPVTAIPRVSYWGIWNEPNERSWLNPWHPPHKGKTLLQPLYYRDIVNTTWRALHATGHGRDTILIGETANRGTVPPLPFVRALYCVDSAYRPLRGAAASLDSCPRSASRKKFVAANPGLFNATGFAHHPYAYDLPPDRPYHDKTWVTLQNIGVLEYVLGHIFSAYRQHGNLPLYLTEWGYKTKPPNPFVHTTLSDQAAWLDEGDYLTWRRGYVKALAQFELVDDGPKAHTRPGSADYWSTFQTGLEFHNGKHKPAYDAYRLPIWLPHAVHGRRVAVWAQLRPADHRGAQTAVLLYHPHHGGKWTGLRFLQTRSSRGFIWTHVPIASGFVRLAWESASGTVYYSRVVHVH